MKCPSCSSDIPDYAGFCAFCGDRINRCKTCARVYPSDVTFCGFCGEALENDDESGSFGRSKGADARAAAIFQTSPGRPGPNANGGRPTLTLPAEQEERDPRNYGILYDPEEPSNRYVLRQGDNTLGAGHNNDIIIDKPAISWNHALLICRNAKVFLQDSASTNGTFVNGKQIDRPRQLENGDAVRFGNVTFHVWLKAQYR
ncbi:MAG: FHA domain-containing protein [Persicimonas sp.]